MKTIDLEKAVKNIRKDKPYRTILTSNVKVQVVGPVEWGKPKGKPIQTDNGGRKKGESEVIKEGLPIANFVIKENAVKGYPTRVEFPGPSVDVKDGTFLARVDESSNIMDITTLHLKTKAPSKDAKITVESFGDRYKYKLSCTLKLGGKVRIIENNDVDTWYTMKQLELAEPFTFKAKLYLHKEDTHTIYVSK